MYMIVNKLEKKNKKHEVNTEIKYTIIETVF